MVNDLAILKTLVSPPGTPRCPSGDWRKIENYLGIEFPQDYKEFISVYGTGSLQSFIHIWNYLDMPSGTDAKGVIEQITKEYEHDRRHGYPIDFKPYPEAGGLIPFASTDDGNYLNWRTDGNSTDWCVVAYENGSGKLLAAEGVNMVRCLRMLVQKNNPFDNAFCNVDSFEPPVTYAMPR